MEIKEENHLKNVYVERKKKDSNFILLTEIEKLKQEFRGDDKVREEINKIKEIKEKYDPKPKHHKDDIHFWEDSIDHRGINDEQFIEYRDIVQKV